MARKISHAEKMTMKTMKDKGSSQREIARLLDVDEKTVRYHLGRLKSEAVDGRSRQELLLVELGLAEAALHWWTVKTELLMARRPKPGLPPKREPSPSIKELHAWLQSTHGYQGSYKSVRKWVRTTFPPSPIRSYRRVETPPGAQMQIDWKEDVKIDIGDPGGPTKLNAFVMELSHSRGTAVVWSRTRDQLAWQHCHVEALKRLGGVAAMGRVDIKEYPRGTQELILLDPDREEHPDTDGGRVTPQLPPRRHRQRRAGLAVDGPRHHRHGPPALRAPVQLPPGHQPAAVAVLMGKKGVQRPPFS